ncbi:hypothetical protein [Spiroplasma endosymbiont of Notiophilus biguttatus]|uniref:hypothetical protein n=1 Tax=Spiroplasma endosymbiont of Notiophilus biguttatus TaxID=3066285 RepID=UPI00313E1B6D
MTYFELKDKSDQYFRKIVGINKLVFNEILNILLEQTYCITFLSFKIIGYKFRKARKRIFLRFNLIAGFYNLSLKLKNVMQ